MKYYQVSVSAEPKIIGVNNGIYQLEIDEKAIEYSDDYDEFKAHFKYGNKEFWNNQDKVKTLRPPTIKGKMLKKAKVTDIMGYAPEYTFLNNLYSEKYLDIIKSFEIVDYKSFEIEIDEIMSRFYLVFFKKILLSEIHFKNSVIYTGHKKIGNVKYFPISNYEEYNSFKIENPLHSFEKISISNNYSNKDIISIQATGGNFYSERLIDFLLDCGITGLQVAYNTSIQLEFG